MGTILAAIEPLEAEARKRVISWVVQKLSIETASVRSASKPQSGQITEPNGQTLDYSTDTVATLIKAKSGPDLIIAAAAHLHFAQGKHKFTRQELTTEMRSAPAHFKETFVNNLSTYLTGLTKADRLRLVGSHTYALSSKERHELEAKLANA